MDEQILTVRGYSFRTEEDAKLARKESQKIDFIEQRLNYNRPESVLAVYKKVLEEKTFQTPVGISFLEKLHDFLENSESITEEIPPIPLQKHYSRTVRENANPARKRINTAKKKDSLKAKYRISVMLNLILIFMVGVMFFIALNGSAPNMLNYEKTLTNKYARWEQELNERESRLRQKEQELLGTEDD